MQNQRPVLRVVVMYKVVSGPDRVLPLDPVRTAAAPSVTKCSTSLLGLGLEVSILLLRLLR